MCNEIEIDPGVTEMDARYLQMSPLERFEHLRKQGHAFPIERSDAEVLEWFSGHPILERRLKLAQALIQQQDKE